VSPDPGAAEQLVGRFADWEVLSTQLSDQLTQSLLASQRQAQAASASTA